MSASPKPVVLLILDGWGIRDPKQGFDMVPPVLEGNAIAGADPKQYKALLAKYPHIAIDASGLAVGLPDGQMGNSEVGHLTMGAGRVVYQDLTLVDKAIQEGDFFENPELLKAIRHAKDNDKTLHLMGLVSDGGVHSHISHLLALLDLCHDNELKKVRVHAFLDGRDVPPQCAKEYLDVVEQNLLAMAYPQIATIAGRYYAMDRDNRWERTELAYDNLVCPSEAANYRPFSLSALESSYVEGELDEFVKPMLTDITFEGIEDGDSVIFFNFRPDRARQITRALTQKEFTGFERKKVLKNLCFICLGLYDETLNLPVAFPKPKLEKLLGEVLSQQGKKQFRTAETEKYAHVTFFFNGGFETPYPGEERMLIPSPKVATYDLQPEMSLLKVTDALLEAIASSQYDFIVANFANPDMVGHTGVMNAALKAVECIDTAIGKVSEAVLKAGGVMLLTADHGNIEMMTDEQGNPHTAHTTDLVPLILVSNDVSLKLEETGDYNLSHLAPTILDLMNIPQPKEMTSESILVRQKVTA